MSNRASEWNTGASRTPVVQRVEILTRLNCTTPVYNIIADGEDIYSLTEADARFIYESLGKFLNEESMKS